MPNAKSGWPSSKGPRSTLAARDAQGRWCDHLYTAIWIDHPYREYADGVTYVAEPYDRLDEEARADLDFLRGLGYEIQVSDDGKHNPGRTLRIAIKPPADETARRRAVRKAVDVARRDRIAWR